MPILFGFSWLATLVASLFGGLVTWLAQYLTKRFAVALAMITLIIGLTTAFYAAITALISTLEVVAPPYFSIALGLFLPSNAKLCIASILSAYVLRWVYDWQVKVLTYKNPGAGF